MPKQKITLDEVKAMDREMLTPKIVGAVIGCDPYNITLMARQRPEMLKFPFLVMGNRTKIPRLAFIAWMEGKAEQSENIGGTK